MGNIRNKASIAFQAIPLCSLIMDNITCGEFSKKELNAICSLAIIEIIFYITYGSIPAILKLTKNQLNPTERKESRSEVRKLNNFDRNLI